MNEPLGYAIFYKGELTSDISGKSPFYRTVGAAKCALTHYEQKQVNWQKWYSQNNNIPLPDEHNMDNYTIVPFYTTPCPVTKAWSDDDQIVLTDKGMEATNE